MALCGLVQINHLPSVYIELVVGQKVFRKDISLSQFISMVSPDFFVQINRQIVVNLRHVTRLHDNVIEVGTEKFRVSVRRKTDVVSRYMKYDLEFR